MRVRGRASAAAGLGVGVGAGAVGISVSALSGRETSDADTLGLIESSGVSRSSDTALVLDGDRRRAGGRAGWPYGDEEDHDWRHAGIDAGADGTRACGLDVLARAVVWDGDRDGGREGEACARRPCSSTRGLRGCGRPPLVLRRAHQHRAQGALLIAVDRDKASVSFAAESAPTRGRTQAQTWAPGVKDQRDAMRGRELSVKWYVHCILGSAFSPILKGLIVCLLNTLYEPIHATQAIVDALAWDVARHADGQRICRQYGLAGRYEDSKCVEKWGPGPMGPGTVCDRCRKKMKRVERRGTLDSMSLNAHLHNQPLAIRPSGAPQAAPGSYTNRRSSHSGSDRSVHRTDTLPTHPSHSSRAPSLNGLSSSAVYSQQDRDRDYDRENGASPYHRSSHRGPTPPSIATLPRDDYDRLLHPSSAHKPNGSMDGHARTLSSRSVSRSPHPKPAATTENTGCGSKSSVSDADVEGEDADDAEAEVDEVDDGDADATERNTLKKEDA
ncbi:uncharacterized protein BXZ73DRAFT_82274 [Epithele typhae]|uniref:uncharacterized protein n=1 Tax=Epithele typhae TaxID=378194 RepID=UPI0020078103|nr:uncharacterized protein BXZ73DRAFT_82274 [Epithele typhae]KAH9912535.1 hypothetical protein BXZ73DRAFT_82274 [Epithele typhae]